jgi:hypothetical protein
MKRQAMTSDRRIVPEALYTLPIPRDVLAERDYRQSLKPRSLTAAMFGDPLPGFSALDKRQGA